MHNRRSRRKLQPRDAKLFAHLEPALFAELAQVVCAAGVLPRKELYECWQMATCVHSAFPEARRVADLAAGHGLLAWMLVLMGRAVGRTGVAVDIARPKSANVLSEAIVARWPELADAVHFVEGSIDAVNGEGALLVATHACGSLSDRVLLRAIESNCPVAIMPCCHSLRKQAGTLAVLAKVAGLSVCGDGDSGSIDGFRVRALVAAGYEVEEDSIDGDITAVNRVIIGKPTRQVATNMTGEIAVGDAELMRTLSLRPSRVWRRSFDLSYWVGDEANGRRLAETFDSLIEERWTRCISVRDQYVEPVTQRVAFTYRIEISSSKAEISPSEASSLRTRLIDATSDRDDVIWRGRRE